MSDSHTKRLAMRSDEEIIAKCREIWTHGWRTIDIAVSRNDDNDNIDITISSMYESPGLTFAQINALAEFFNTMKVETEEEISESGCESCDYGSRYGFVLRVSPGAPFQRLLTDEQVTK